MLFGSPLEVLEPLLHSVYFLLNTSAVRIFGDQFKDLRTEAQYRILANRLRFLPPSTSVAPFKLSRLVAASTN
jgi:hypothetical protein